MVSARFYTLLLELWQIWQCITVGLSVVLLVVMCLWILLGVFVYPQKLLPWAAGVVGIVGHVTSLYTQLTDMRRKLVRQLTQALNEALRELNKVKKDLGLDVPDLPTDIKEPDDEQLMLVASNPGAAGQNLKAELERIACEGFDAAAALDAKRRAVTTVWTVELV